MLVAIGYFLQQDDGMQGSELEERVAGIEAMGNVALGMSLISIGIILSNGAVAAVDRYKRNDFPEDDKD